jgi:hypothetical protein
MCHICIRGIFEEEGMWHQSNASVNICILFDTNTYKRYEFEVVLRNSWSAAKNKQAITQEKSD